VGPRRRDRSLLGEAQWRWLEDELAARPATRWRLLTSQVVVAPVRGGPLVNPGQWDGYPDERDRLLRLLGNDPVPTVVVSGDLHSSWVSQLQAGGRTVAMELTSPAVSAPSFARKLAPPLPGGRRLLEWLIRRQNRHIRWVDTAGHGYLVLDVTAERIEAEWWHVATVDRRGRAERCAARLTIPAAGGEFGLEVYSSSSRRAATNAS
jgi:alkaline phosphatase D